MAARRLARLDISQCLSGCIPEVFLRLALWPVNAVRVRLAVGLLHATKKFGEKEQRSRLERVIDA